MLDPSDTDSLDRNHHRIPRLRPPQEGVAMKVFVVHVYDAAGQLHDYYVHATIETAVRDAASGVVAGRFEDLDPQAFDTEVARVAGEIHQEPRVGRCHVRCGAWSAHVDEMLVSCSPIRDPGEILTNPDCQGVIETIGACGHNGYYCSDRCWSIGQLRNARARVLEYERRLGAWSAPQEKVLGP